MTKDSLFADAQLDQFEATIPYIARGQIRPVMGAYGNRMDMEEMRVTMTNARSLPQKPTLEVEGFTLSTLPTSVTNFDDDAAMHSQYFPEIADHIRELTGASKVLVYPHYVYRQTKLNADGQTFRLPAGQGAHIDWTETCARQFLAVLADVEETLASYSRVAIYQAWRALSGGRQDLPLALTDGRTVSVDDLTVADTRVPPEMGPVTEFEFYLGSSSPDHRWYFYKSMAPEDLIIFQGYDFNEPDKLKVLHTAFVDETCPTDVPPRRSLEVRTFAFFD